MSNHHLAVQLQDSHDHYDYMKNERDELQKRVDVYERQGYKLVPVDELLRKVQNIRALNTGEYASDEIEENVCEIEAMIGAVE